MMMLGERVHAEIARDWGMVYEVVHEDMLEEQAWRLAERLAAGPTVALGLMRQGLNHALDASYAEAMAREAENQRAARSSADSMEGGMAFLQKRKPEFRGQ
jgi:2-(1,2-epoxy-1,2-dihydrophenyl)acetyl-CoA isomerase